MYISWWSFWRFNFCLSLSKGKTNVLCMIMTRFKVLFTVYFFWFIKFFCKRLYIKSCDLDITVSIKKLSPIKCLYDLYILKSLHVAIFPELSNRADNWPLIDHFPPLSPPAPPCFVFFFLNNANACTCVRAYIFLPAMRVNVIGGGLRGGQAELGWQSLFQQG